MCHCDRRTDAELRLIFRHPRSSKTRSVWQVGKDHSFLPELQSLLQRLRGFFFPGEPLPSHRPPSVSLSVPPEFYSPQTPQAVQSATSSRAPVLLPRMVLIRSSVPEIYQLRFPLLRGGRWTGDHLRSPSHAA